MCTTNTPFRQPKDADTSSTLVATAALIVTTPPVRCLLRPPSSSQSDTPPTLRTARGGFDKASVLEGGWRLQTRGPSVVLRRSGGTAHLKPSGN